MTDTLGEWTHIDGLTDTANTLFAEEWALMDWLANHDVTHPDWAGVLQALVANGLRIDVLGEGKYK